MECEWRSRYQTTLSTSKINNLQTHCYFHYKSHIGFYHKQAKPAISWPATQSYEFTSFWLAGGSVHSHFAAGGVVGWDIATLHFAEHCCKNKYQGLHSSRFPLLRALQRARLLVYRHLCNWSWMLLAGFVDRVRADLWKLSLIKPLSRSALHVLFLWWSWTTVLVTKAKEAWFPQVYPNSAFNTQNPSLPTSIPQKRGLAWQIFSSLTASRYISIIQGCLAVSCSASFSSSHVLGEM